MRTTACATLCTAGLLIVATPAVAAWTAQTPVAVHTTADALATPATPHVHLDDTTVEITWIAPTGGAPAANWQVHRDTTLVCTTTAADLSCTDSPPTDTPVRYTVRSVLEGWTSPASPPSDDVTVPPSISPLQQLTVPHPVPDSDPPPADPPPVDPPAADPSPTDPVTPPADT